MTTLFAQSVPESQYLLERLLDHEHSGWLIFGTVITLCVGFKTVGGVIRSIARERTRREIAAFIAEGSMTPEQGERLMKSGEKQPS